MIGASRTRILIRVHFVTPFSVCWLRPCNSVPLLHCRAAFSSIPHVIFWSYSFFPPTSSQCSPGGITKIHHYIAVQHLPDGNWWCACTRAHTRPRVHVYANTHTHYTNLLCDGTNSKICCLSNQVQKTPSDNFDIRRYISFVTSCTRYIKKT